MKILTIKQPWAGLILKGRKTIELRTWSTAYRGPVVIHAGRAFDKRGAVYEPSGKPGHTLCVVDLMDVRRATASDMDSACVGHLGLRHEDYFSWVLADVRAIKEQPLRGALGLCHVPDSISLFASA